MKGMAGEAIIGGALGGLSGASQAAYKGFKIAHTAKSGVGNYGLGTANRTTSFFAGKFFTAGSKGLRNYRGPTVKESGPHIGKIVSNFERFVVKPTSRSLKQYPNRAGNGHLRIKGWW